MNLQTLRNAISQWLVCVIKRVEQHFKHSSQPNKGSLLQGRITDMTRSKSELIVENAFLPQQLIVLRHQTKRPGLTAWDRGFLVCYPVDCGRGKRRCSSSNRIPYYTGIAKAFACYGDRSPKRKLDNRAFHLM
jgi:hypothetical protein